MGLSIDISTAPANYQSALGYGACPEQDWQRNFNLPGKGQADKEPAACEKDPKDPAKRIPPKELDRPWQAAKAANYFCQQATTPETDCQKFLDFLAERYYYGPRINQFVLEIKSAGHTEQAVELAGRAVTVAKMSTSNSEKVDLVAQVAGALIETGWLRNAEATLRSVAGEKCVYTYDNGKRLKEETDFCYNGNTVYNNVAFSLIGAEAYQGNYKKALEIAGTLKQAPLNRVMAYEAIVKNILRSSSALQHKPELVRALKGEARALKMVKERDQRDVYFKELKTMLEKAGTLLTKQEAQEIINLAK